jgi:hypothetical protein
MAQPHLLRLRAGRDVGLTFFMRYLNHADALMVGVCGVLGETVGTGEGRGLWGNGGQSFGFPNVSWSGTQVSSAERFQTECVGTTETVGSFSVEHRWLGCSCCELGALEATEGVCHNEHLSAVTVQLRGFRMDFLSKPQKGHARNVLLQHC